MFICQLPSWPYFIIEFRLNRADYKLWKCVCQTNEFDNFIRKF